MTKRFILAIVAVLAIATLADRAFAGCTLGKIAELPVTMAGLRPMVSAKINGANALFIADSGAFYSVITPASAAEFGLRLRPAPFNMTMRGLGGEAQISLATVKEFTLANVPIHNVDFIVGGSESGNGAAGLLGQNVFRIADVEYDLANGTIRLIRPSGCGSSMLAYWDKSQPYSALDIGSTTPLAPHTTGVAFVNGVKLRVVFDTGAATSILALSAARRAGVNPRGAGVVAAGFTGGIGRRMVETWIAPVDSFKIGDEEVRNTRLRIGDASLNNADMWIGADFFLSHRVYVANSQHKLYFTYNGGPVFNLNSITSVQAGAASPTQSVPKLDEGGSAPTDAAGLSRRGAAFAARRDFGRAIADLTRACELQPNEPRYFYERGMAYLGNKQPFLAMTDFDQTLKLKPDDVQSLVTRAELRLAGRDQAQASLDLGAADRFASKEADVRLRIAGAYLRADLFSPAIAQYDLWITAHPQDVRRGQAMNGRCWARALWGRELDKALADCDAAQRMNPKLPSILDSRGLVRLRLGDFDKAIADFNAALGLQPRNAWSFYGRGLAELRKGLTADGAADIAAGTALQPNLPEEVKKSGIVP